jgi:hypothetical protein
MYAAQIRSSLGFTNLSSLHRTSLALGLKTSEASADIGVANAGARVRLRAAVERQATRTNAEARHLYARPLSSQVRKSVGVMRMSARFIKTPSQAGESMGLE